MRAWIYGRALGEKDEGENVDKEGMSSTLMGRGSWNRRLGHGTKGETRGEGW